MNLNGILIGSAQPDRLVEYYSKLFGAPGWEEGGYSSWRIGSGWLTIGGHDQVKGSNAHPGRIIWNIETPDVRGEVERLKGAGATVVREPYTPDGEDTPEMLIATFADPDDNYFQLTSPMPEEMPA